MTLLFDLDGTLVDCKELHFKALNQALEFFGYKPISKKDHINKFDGLPTQTKLEMLQITNIGEVNYKKQELTSLLIPNLIKTNLEVQEAIIELSLEYKLFCVSNSKIATIELILKHTGLYEFFDKIISCEDVNRPKPYPDIYIKAKALAKDNVIAFEDNKNGLQSAKNAKVKVFPVIDSSHIRYEHITNLINYA